MKRRLRWLGFATTRSGIEAIAARLLQAPYSNRRGSGFLVDQVRPGLAVARHVERFVRTVTTVDPFGKQLTQTLVAFNQASFTLSVAKPGLRIVDPPRSLAMLLNQLGAATDFQVAIEEIDLDPLSWLGRLEAKGLTATVGEIEFVEVAFPRGAAADIVVHGPSDVRDAAQRIVGERSRHVKRVAARLRGEGGDSFDVVLERNGRAQLEEDAGDFVVHAVESALRE